ncbi:MAG TPA: hypothetical protein VHW73_15095 [Rudaea sp.]|nr:hypothetical protein [Rudaea sp.]
MTKAIASLLVEIFNKDSTNRTFGQCDVRILTESCPTQVPRQCIRLGRVLSAQFFFGGVMSFYKSSTRKSCVARREKVAAMWKQTFSALLLFLGFIAQANAVCYVNGTATGANNGSSWIDAYTNPQFALLDPAVCMEIWVAKGVYKPTLGTDPTVYFEINAGVTIYGGFAGNEVVRDARVPAVNVTVLSGDIGNDDANAGGNQVDATTSDIHGTNSYHVVFVQGASGTPVTGSTVLDGFTITGGNASDLVTPIASGGGLYCNGSGSGNECSPTLRNLIFSGNAAARSGGGIYNNGDSGGVSSPILIDITFTGNRAVTSGGAIHDDANDGISSPSLTNVFFGANSASLGGAMYSLATGGGSNKALSSPTLTSVAFVGNSAEVGGAMYSGSLTGGVTNPKLSVVTFSGNSTPNDPTAFGGGMYNPSEGAGS